MQKLCLCLHGLCHRKQYTQVQSLSVSPPVPAPADLNSSSQSSPSPQPQAESVQPPALRKESSSVYIFNQDKVRMVEQQGKVQEAPVGVSQEKVASVRKRLASL